MLASPSSVACAATACIVALLLGTGCARPGESVEPGPVVIVALDGFAWEVIAPMLGGEEYPVIDWAEPVELVGGDRWTAIPAEVGRAAAPGVGATLRVEDAASPQPAGLATTVELDFPRVDRYRISGRARAATTAGRFTLGVRYSFAGGEPPPLVGGNNETVCRTFDLGSDGAALRLDLQPPTTALTMSILLLSGEVDCVAPGFERTGGDVGSNPPVEVTELALLPGKLRGLPRGGFDWASLPADGGRLPNLARLIRDGVSGYLRNIEPTKSPVIWTSVATGEGPDEHGIEDFLMPAPGAQGRIHVSSTLRRTPALWNIVTDYGPSSVGVVSWWASWPAEEVRGFIVTDHANEGAVRVKEDRGYLPKAAGIRAVYGEYDTYPRDLARRLERQPAATSGLRQEDLRRVLPGLDEELWRRFSDISAVDRHDPDSLLKFYLLKDLVTLRTGLPLFEELSPDLWMLYINGQDSLQHLFWHHADPDLYPRADPTLLPLYGRVVENYYALVDDFIGRIAAAAGPRANLILLSDHGVYGVDFMQSGSRSGNHAWRSRGILVASGPAFERGRYTETASIFDIAPTALALLDYPVAGDLEGKPLLQLLRPDWRQRHPIRQIDRYEFLSPRPGAEAVDSEFGAEISERLRALGYLD